MAKYFSLLPFYIWTPSKGLCNYCQTPETVSQVCYHLFHVPFQSIEAQISSG